MIDPSLPLQAAIVAALKASIPVTALIGTRIYDKVPTNQAGQPPADIYPYASFGPISPNDDSDTCHDGAEVFVQIDCWSRSVGGVECKRIGAAILLELDRPLTVAGFKVAIHEVESARYPKPSDGLTSQGILTFRYVLDPTS